MTEPRPTATDEQPADAELPTGGPICTTAAARAAGLDIPPAPAELSAMAAQIVRTTANPHGPEADLARAVPLLLEALATAQRDRDTTTTRHLGADQAERIRTAARELADLPGIENTSTGREVLYDIAQALADLATPVHALVEDHLETRNDGDEDYASQARAAITALTAAAAGLQHVADNH